MGSTQEKVVEATDGTTDLWLFGYGSLIWKPPPKHDLRIPGYIEGYVRRFWQARSEDHRGTPEAPGRVVTLIDRAFWETLTDAHTPAPSRVWGAAYRIPAHDVPEMREYLDLREINGYSVHYTPFYWNDSDISESKADVNVPNPISCMVYIGLPENPQFLGPQDPQRLAEHIAISRGPSGENKDYLYQLDTALNALSHESSDEHVSDLTRRVRQIESGRQDHK